MDRGWLRVLRRRVAPEAFFTAADIDEGRSPLSSITVVLDAAVELTIERVLCSGGSAAAPAATHAALQRRVAACVARWPASLAAYVCIFDDERHVPLARSAAPPARRVAYPPAADAALPGAAGQPILPYPGSAASAAACDSVATAELAAAELADPWRACATPRVRRRLVGAAAAFLANECRMDGAAAARPLALVVDGGGLAADGALPQHGLADAVLARTVGGGDRRSECAAVPLARPPIGEAALKAVRWAADLSAGRLRGIFGDAGDAGAGATLVRAPLEALAPLLLAAPDLIAAALARQQQPPPLYLEVCEFDDAPAAAGRGAAANTDVDGDDDNDVVLISVLELWRALVGGGRALPGWLPLPVETVVWLMALAGDGDGGGAAFVEATPHVGPCELWSALVDPLEWRAPADGEGGFVERRDGPPHFGAWLLTREALALDEAVGGGARIVRGCEMPQLRFLAYALQRLHAAHVVQPGWPPGHVANLVVLRHEIARLHEGEWAVPPTGALAARCRRATWCVNYWAAAHRDGFGGADRSCDADAASGLPLWGWAREPSAGGAVVRTDEVWNARLYA